MFFFKKFPKFQYHFSNDEKLKNQKEVTNILSAFFLRKISSYHNVFFDHYNVRDDDSIESLSDKIYNTPMYYWTILLINDIVDPFTEWKMNHEVLERFTKKKYKDGIQFKKKDGTVFTLPFSEGLHGIHHFINVQTNIIIDDHDDLLYRQLYIDSNGKIGQNIFPVTNFQYEQDENMKKRKIMLVSPRYILSFEEDFKNMLKGTKK